MMFWPGVWRGCRVILTRAACLIRPCGRLRIYICCRVSGFRLTIPEGLELPSIESVSGTELTASQEE